MQYSTTDCKIADMGATLSFVARTASHTTDGNKYAVVTTESRTSLNTRVLKIGIRSASVYYRHYVDVLMIRTLVKQRRRRREIMATRSPRVAWISTRPAIEGRRASTFRLSYLPK